MREIKGFSRRLKLVREAFSVSQAELAEALGLKQYYITKWESGRYKPNPTIQLKISKYFNVDPFWLSGGKPVAFIGIVFIPQYFLSRPLFYMKSLKRIVDFVYRDGATPHQIIANKNGEDGFIVFKRGEQLLLFLPFKSFTQPPSTYSLKFRMLYILTDGKFTEISPSKAVEEIEKEDKKVKCEIKNSKVIIYSLSSEEFKKIDHKTPLEELENILGISIPAVLKEINKMRLESPLYKEMEVLGESLETKIQERKGEVKNEWIFSAEIKISAPNKKFTEDEAYLDLLRLEDTYNKVWEKQIHILKLKRKK
jgi:transcriptional regulator with XRE-family HTH domain